MEASLKKFLIKGYEGLYSITKDGSVWSHPKRRSSKQGIYLKPGVNTRGYKQVVLYKDNKHKNITIHRLIALTFINNPDNKLEVNHIDGNKLNNKIENLEWCTSSENHIHAYKNDNHKRMQGELHGASKLKEVDVLNIKKLIENGAGCRELGRAYSVCHSLISMIKNGKRWTHLKEVA